MGIFDEIQQRKQQKQYVADISEAEKIFKAQKGAINGIKKTAGLKEVLAYWVRQKEANEQRFETAKIEDKDKYFALYKQAKNFITFIQNLSK